VQFNVSQLMREPTGSRRQYSVDDTFLPQEDAPVQVRVRGPVELLRTHRGILARARLQSEGQGECARCLNQVGLPVTLEIEDEFLPTVDPVSGARLPNSDEPGTFPIDAHHTLDLTDSVRQAWVVTMPMRLLCRDDCAGLCPTCGADLNGGACGCAAGPIDPRWVALAALPRHQLKQAPEEN
jgi:uncharacterized protein